MERNTKINPGMRETIQKKEGKKNIKRGRKICKREKSEVFKKSHDEERENKIQRKDKNHEKPKIKA